MKILERQPSKRSFLRYTYFSTTSLFWTASGKFCQRNEVSSVMNISWTPVREALYRAFPHGSCRWSSPNGQFYFQNDYGLIEELFHVSLYFETSNCEACMRTGISYYMELLEKIPTGNLLCPIHRFLSPVELDNHFISFSFWICRKIQNLWHSPQMIHFGPSPYSVFKILAGCAIVKTIRIFLYAIRQKILNWWNAYYPPLDTVSSRKSRADQTLSWLSLG